MFCHQTPPDVANALTDLLRRHDPQITIRKRLHEHRGARCVAVGLELPRDRDHVAIADATDLDDLHASSIYEDSRCARDCHAPPPPSPKSAPTEVKNVAASVAGATSYTLNPRAIRMGASGEPPPMFEMPPPYTTSDRPRLRIPRPRHGPRRRINPPLSAGGWAIVNAWGECK